MAPLVFHPIYSQLDLPERHRFPIDKYQGIKDCLLEKGVLEQSFTAPEPVSLAQLAGVFEPDYVFALGKGELEHKAMRRIGFPWSEQLIQRSLTAVGGTVLTGLLALEKGLALNLTGGYHHAFADFGSGFCLFNDLYLCALKMLEHRDIDKVLIFDCDVHQGDGTAKLAEHRQDIITVSLHGEKNFPHHKQISDMDFPLPKGTGDSQYLDTLDTALTLALDIHRPDAVIYDAGVDIHIDDDLGHLDITTDGILARDKYVLETCRSRELPTACVIGGGYRRDNAALVEVHSQLYRAAGVID